MARTIFPGRELASDGELRARTNEQVAREFKVLLEVEKERARRRQAEAARQTNAARSGETLVETFPQASEEEQGDARDKAAEKLHASGKTLEKMASPCVRRPRLP